MKKQKMNVIVNEKMKEMKVLVKKNSRLASIVIGILVALLIALIFGGVRFTMRKSAERQLATTDAVNELEEGMRAELEDMLVALTTLDQQTEENREALQACIEQSNRNANMSETQFDMLQTQLENSHIETTELTEKQITELQGLMTYFESMHSEIGDTSTLIEALKEELQGMDSKQNDQLQAAYETIVNRMNSLEEMHQTSMTQVDDMLKQLSSDLKDEQNALYDTLLSMKQDLNENGSANLDILTKNFGEQSDSLKQTMTEQNDSIKQTMVAQNDAIKQTMTEQNDSLKQTLSDQNNSFQLSIEKFQNNMGDSLAEYTAIVDSQYESLSNQYTAYINQWGEKHEGLLTYLQNAMAQMDARLDQVFQSVSNGKKMLASALLTKGVTVEEDASFKSIAEGIMSIEPVILVENMPGDISYDYHYHADGTGQEPHTNEVALDCQGNCYQAPVYHIHEGSTDTYGGCYTEQGYHVHTGSPYEGGGCYGSAIIHHHSDACYAKGTCNVSRTGYRTSWEGGTWYEYYTESHSSCGRGTAYNVRSAAMTHETGYSHTYNAYIICGKSDGEIVGYSLNCGKNEETPEGYQLGCGMTEETVVGFAPSCGLVDGQIICAHIQYVNATEEEMPEENP